MRHLRHERIQVVTRPTVCGEPYGLGFGPNRLPATTETPSDTITILHATAPLTPGHYAVFCGTLANTYELIVK